MRRPAISFALASILPLGSAALAAPKISVSLEPSSAPVNRPGRMVVFLVNSDSGLDEKTAPIDGPFWESEQPIFGMDFDSLLPDREIVIDAGADGYPGNVGALKRGKYRAQACAIVRREDSNWKRVSGNLYSERGDLEIDADGNGSVRLKLDRLTQAPDRKSVDGVDWFATPSTLLSDFRGEPVELRAGVVFPLEYDPSKKYRAIYFVPGFGGDDLDAARFAIERASSTGPARDLAKQTFLIVLNPEGPNGHTLFADSANNGPCAKALTTELIPALEKEFPLIAKPEARILRGHSSGGWSTIWLALTEPNTFGVAWSSSPDPVDFRKFQVVNIYDEDNFYTAPTKTESGALMCEDRPSFRELDRTTGKARNVMTIRREAMQEDVLGPDNTSGQQWDSWFAVFGPRNAAGHPAALFDPATGVIDHAVAEKYRAFDIGAMVRADPDRYLPLLRYNVRIMVGDSDSFFLNEAVSLLKEDVDHLVAAKEQPSQTGWSDEAPAGHPPPPEGYIKVLPGYDHGTIFQSPEIRAIDREMLDYLKDLDSPHK
ncbi:MAG: hypothetical protein KF691_14530 [Phycisphaeraceae bacterium]|nr:hypothetical protein [Phycisphaeraceae bacterium]